MGTILERKRKDGTTGYHAQIVIKRDGKIAHRETMTFDRRPAASAWIKKREHELAQPGAVDRAKIDDPTLAVAIQRYIDESSKAMGRTKAQVLRTIKTYSIVEKRCSEIASPDLVSFAQQLAGGRAPQTVANYLAHLGAVFAVARPAWGYPLDEKAMKDAIVVAKRLGVTSKSRQRDRRPTRDEMDRLLAHFEDRSRRRPNMAPMCAIVVFALFSARRLEEITRIGWADLDAANNRVMVRDMKNPGEKAGNDVWVDLTPEALAVVLAQPRGNERIFPHSADAIGANFTRGVALLGIKDLHFHDLRHEGVSRLFEQGKSIPHVAAVSGHRSWVSLKRYTHLHSTTDKWAGWPWLVRIAQPPQQLAQHLRQVAHPVSD